MIEHGKRNKLVVEIRSAIVIVKSYPQIILTLRKRAAAASGEELEDDGRRVGWYSAEVLVARVHEHQTHEVDHGVCFAEEEGDGLRDAGSGGAVVLAVGDEVLELVEDLRCEGHAADSLSICTVTCASVAPEVPGIFVGEVAGCVVDSGVHRASGQPLVYGSVVRVLIFEVVPDLESVVVIPASVSAWQSSDTLWLFLPLVVQQVALKPAGLQKVVGVSASSLRVLEVVRHRILQRLQFRFWAVRVSVDVN